jgi:PAS domain S-box-containing protein
MEDTSSNEQLTSLLALCRKQKDDLERLLNIVPAMICITDQDGHFLYLNREWEKTLGFPLKALKAKSLFDLLHPDDHESTRAEIERQLKGGATLNFENRYRCQEGFYKLLKWRAAPARGGKLFAVAEDVTARRRTLAAHLESEERYRSLVENTLDGYFIAEIPSGRFIFLNDSSRKLFGYRPQETTDLTFWDVIAPPEHAVITERIRARLKDSSRRFADSIYTAVRKDGSTFRTEISTSLVSYKGRPAFQGVLRDITERERLRQQLEQAQKMESVGRLAGGVAHDFNNMLSVIGGYAELALEKTAAEEELRADLGEILKAARRSTDITRQLLAFARQQPITPKVLDLNEAVESTFKMLRRLISEDIDLAWHPKVELWPVKIDPVQIDQILANLCVNARDAIAGIGRITIETDARGLEGRDVDGLPYMVPGDYVILSVSDDGCGMDRETQNHIFEPFFTSKEVGRGTGLGLSTVYGIVKQNNGFINVDSAPGEGTVFKVYLPRYREETGSADPVRQAAIPSGQGETLLLVEDEASILTLGRRMLESLGYRVFCAATPGDALDLADELAGAVDLLITDVVMPEMSGKRLSELLQARYPHIGTLFMSGYAAGAMAEHGVLEERVAFVQKPFSKKELAEKVRAALAGIDSGK